MAVADPPRITQVPATDHIARYCGLKYQQNGVPQATAFRLDVGKGEPYLSVNWLERLSAAGRAIQIAALRNTFRRKGFNLGANALFAVLNGECPADC